MIRWAGARTVARVSIGKFCDGQVFFKFVRDARPYIVQVRRPMEHGSDVLLGAPCASLTQFEAMAEQARAELDQALAEARQWFAANDAGPPRSAA